eukprot:gnl/TRDRNA2_/TRDRNA2_182555_c0_seq1.p1 gnl/TRDRNA2_/TRDRNA2_182555_c0~~gnl/TRDRNA2_/TRDRNA2_182555_c0_seq1.p1  ORF type:complete len:464 (+),score=101.75 gnl/TRDRNA2_/TRDRNA2_182555_c0_seq1:90-1481(+)
MEGSAGVGPPAFGSLLSVERQVLSSTYVASDATHVRILDNLAWTFREAFWVKDNHYTLFRSEDWLAWTIFSSVFVCLIIFDNVILSSNPKALTMSRALAYTLFWILAAGAFCAWVWWWYSENHAFMWMSGYMLEWMLSFDNLFVFHLIFSVYGTPDRLKHKPLFYGICGAVFFRLIFIFIGEWMMHTMFFAHFVFGAFLVYTGLKTVTADEEDEDPSQQPIVQFLQKKVRFVSEYDDAGAFFVRVPVDDRGEPVIPDSARRGPGGEAAESDSLVNARGEQDKFGTVDFAAAREEAKRASDTPRIQWRATMLFLVVCCLEISDLLFAVDSVSAIVAQVNDLFLAYTSCIFAMLGLRATFFIIDVLVQLFSLLKYGVAAVLVFIGVKLIIGRYYHVPPSVVCVFLVTAIASSMIASYIQDELKKKREGRHCEEIDVRVAKVKESSPSPIAKLNNVPSPIAQGSTV